MTRFVCLPLLTLAACQAAPQENAVNDMEAANQAEAPIKEIETLPPNETPVADNALPAEDETAVTTVPAAFHGRWGLVPADCTSTRGDAKGLMIVDAESLRFYESRAVPRNIVVEAPERWTAQLDYSGEGQTWSERTTMSLSNAGKTLARRADGVWTYTRCA